MFYQNLKHFFKINIEADYYSVSRMIDWQLVGLDYGLESIQSPMFSPDWINWIGWPQSRILWRGATSSYLRRKDVAAQPFPAFTPRPLAPVNTQSLSIVALSLDQTSPLPIKTFHPSPQMWGPAGHAAGSPIVTTNSGLVSTDLSESERGESVATATPTLMVICDQTHGSRESGGVGGKKEAKDT